MCCGECSMSHIRIERLTKRYDETPALDGVSLEIGKGSMVGLIGPSGSGKSTLLRLLSGLVVGNRGEANGGIWVGGRLIQANGRLDRDIRNTRGKIGFVFQQFNLVNRLSVMTNVLVGCLKEVPLWRSLLMWFTRAERAAALEALHRVGIPEQAWKRASDLSGGQQQRAAIARALVQRAEVVLADEPIASLDPESSRRVMETLSRINREDNITVVVSLHQVDIAMRYCPRVVGLKHGRIVYDGAASDLTPEILQDLYGVLPEAYPEFDPAPAAPIPAFGTADTAVFPESA